jgi:hypothetical protein
VAGIFLGTQRAGSSCGTKKTRDFRYAEAGFSFYKKAPYQEQRS